MHKNNNGMALISVMIVLVILTILGIAVLGFGLSETKQVIQQENYLKSYYAARSGADAMASYFIFEPTIEKVNASIGKTGTGEIDTRSFEVTVTGNERSFLIESTAYKLNGSDREYEKTVSLLMKEVNLMSFAIFADEGLNVGRVTSGNVGSNGNSINTVNAADSDVNGNIILGVNATETNLSYAESLLGDDENNYVDKLVTPIVLPAIDSDNFDGEPLPLPDITGLTNLYLTLLENPIPPEYPGMPLIVSLDIITNKYKGSYQVDNISLGGSGGELKVEGYGDLHLLLNDSFSFDGSANINTTSNTRLFLYYDCTDPLVFNGTTNMRGGIYAPHAEVKFNGGGEFYGAIICKKFTAGASSNYNIVADNSMSMKDFNITGIAGYERSAWSD